MKLELSFLILSSIALSAVASSPPRYHHVVHHQDQHHDNDSWDDHHDDPNCTMKPNPGRCRAAIKKWYWDAKEGKCKMFIYGGCGGSVPFNTKEDCEWSECKKASSTTSTSTGTIVSGGKCKCPPVPKCLCKACKKCQSIVHPPPRPKPKPQPKPKPIPTLRSSGCHQSGCVSYDGPGDYKVIGNSMSYSEDRRNCRLKHSTTAFLPLPKGVKIKKAILYWSGSGSSHGRTTVSINGHSIHSGKAYNGGFSQGALFWRRHYKFYGAEADVTHLIKKGGMVKVAGVKGYNNRLYCYMNATYAAWTLIVVYSKHGYRPARINVCTAPFKFTWPAGNHCLKVGCLKPKPHQSAVSTCVGFEGDSYKGEKYIINGHNLGDNLWRGSTAPNFDIITKDVGRYLRHGAHSIHFCIKNYITRSRWGRALEGMSIPVRVVKQTF